MKLKTLMMLVLWGGVLLLASTVWAAPDLAGQWHLNGQPYLTLDKGGTGSLDGEPVQWSVQGNNLVLGAGGETQSLPFRYHDSALTLQVGLVPVTLQRAPQRSGRGADAPSARPEPGRSGSDQLSSLLLSSAWCSFKYNQYSGTSSSTRVQFFKDGTYSNSARAETYNSGRHGSVAGQHDSGGSGEWTVRSGRLHISVPPEQPDLVPVSLTINYNSSGYPILTADGVEYSICR